MPRVFETKVSVRAALESVYRESDVCYLLCRIVRAFLIEEQKIVVRALKAQQAK